MIRKIVNLVSIGLGLAFLINIGQFANVVICLFQQGRLFSECNCLGIFNVFVTNIICAIIFFIFPFKSKLKLTKFAQNPKIIFTVNILLLALGGALFQVSLEHLIYLISCLKVSFLSFIYIIGCGLAGFFVFPYQFVLKGVKEIHNWFKR